jgi:hypothetical protein
MSRSTSWQGWVAAGALMTLGSPTLAQFAGFADQTPYPTIDSTTDCILADLDNDGDLDFAGNSLREATFDRAVVLLNNGDGTFGSPAFYGVGSSPVAIASADMDLDGDIDLILANRDTDDLSLLLNNGNGTFLAEIIIPAGGLPIDLAIADFNTDGRPDIAVSDSGQSNVRVYFGGADVTSWGPPNFVLTTHGGGGTGGQAPNNLIAKDLNLDGAPDIATSNAGSDTLTIMYNTGSGSFFSGDFAILVDTGENPGDLACADMNGDGEPDLIVIDRIDNTVSVHFNNWNGGANTFPTFPTSTTIAVAGSPEGLAIADLGAEEGDGDKDILVATISAGVNVLLNNGSGVLTDGGNYGTSSDSEPAAGDLDGDGDADVVLCNAPANQINVLLNATLVIGGPDPVARIDSPSAFGLSGSCVCLAGSEVTGVADVPGGVFESYRLEYRPVSSPTDWTTIVNSFDSVPEPGGLLGMMDVGGLAEGLYLLRLCVESASGLSSTAEQVVWVSTDYDSLDWILARGNIAAGDVSSAEIVGGNACLFGTAADGNCGPDEYMVEFSRAGEEDWMLIDPNFASYPGGKVNQLLADWDTTGVDDGAYDLRVVASNGCGDMKTVQRSNILVDNTPPVAQIDSPLNCDPFNPTGMLDIVGTASDENISGWSLAYTGGDTNAWVTIASGNESVTNGVIASWDIASLRPCAYTIRLRVSDKAVVNCNSGRTREFYTSINIGCRADLAPPYNELNFDDVLAFLTSFGAGCP